MYDTALYNAYLTLPEFGIKPWSALRSSLSHLPSMSLTGCSHDLPSQLHLCLLSNMNALDFLFDFATLMSVPSAMTLSSDSNDVPEMQIQEPWIPKEIPNQGAQTCFSHEQNPHQGALPQHNHNITQHQPAYQTPSFPQHKGMTASAEPDNVEHQYFRYTERHHSMQLPGFKCELACGHDPKQLCPCKCIPPIKLCPQYGCSPPWETSQIPPQLQEQFQASPEEGPPCEYDFGSCYVGEPRHRNYLPSHSYCIRDEYFPVVPQVTSSLHENSGTPVGWSNDRLAVHRDELFRY